MNRVAFFIFILFSCLVHDVIIAQEYYVQGNRPVYVIPESVEQSEDFIEVVDGRFDNPSQFFSRSGLTSSEEEIEKDVYDEAKAETVNNGSTRLPPNFSEEVRRNRRFPPRASKKPLKADPGKIDREEFEEEQEVMTDDPNSRGLSRFLWPFSVSVTKGKGHATTHDHGPPHHLGGPYHRQDYGHHYHHHGHGHGHHHHGHGHHHHKGHGAHHIHGHGHGWDHGYYNHYPKKGKGHHHLHSLYGESEPFKGLSEHDIEILESKGYKKYQKKKKKKIKKLKKKLKLKRIFQKILEKKINYFDSLGIEGGDEYY